MSAYAEDIFRAGVKIATESVLDQMIVRLSLLSDIRMFIAKERTCQGRRTEE